MKDRSVEERTPRARLNANRGEAGQLARLKSAALLVRVGLDHEPWLRRAGEAGRRSTGARRAPRSRSLAQHHAAADGDAAAARRRGAAPARLRQPARLARSRERAAQFLAGRSELVAGDRLVLRTLRAKARERQRYWLGLPLLALGGVIAISVSRRARSRASSSP